MKYTDLEFLGYFKDIEIKVVLNGDNKIKVESRKCLHRTKDYDLCYDCRRLTEENRNEYDKFIEHLKDNPRQILHYRLSA